MHYAIVWQIENSLTLFIFSQQNKPVTPLAAGKVPSEQDANSTKEFRASDPSSRPKDQTQENEPPKVTIGSQVNNDLEKGRLDIGQAKIVPISNGEETLKDKANPVADEKQPSATKANAVVCEDQGSVKNATENSNLDKGSLNSNQDKKKTSINESSNNQNMNDKNVNLPVQDEGSQSAKVVKTDGERWVISLWKWVVFFFFDWILKFWWNWSSCRNL